MPRGRIFLLLLALALLLALLAAVVVPSIGFADDIDTTTAPVGAYVQTSAGADTPGKDPPRFASCGDPPRPPAPTGTPSPTATTTATAPTRPPTAVPTAPFSPTPTAIAATSTPKPTSTRVHTPTAIAATSTPKPTSTRVHTPTAIRPRRGHVDAKTDIYPDTYAHGDRRHVDAHIDACISERAAGRNRQARIDSNSGEPNCSQTRPRPQLHPAPRGRTHPPVPNRVGIGLVDLRHPNRTDPARQRGPPGTRAIQRELADRPSTGPVQIQPAARRVARQPSRHIDHLRRRQSLRLLNLQRRPHRALELVTCSIYESSCSCS